jgi:DNA-binding LacI/PurR family transcriptional regulator
VRLDTDPFLIVARACGLGADTVSKVLTIGPWRYRLSEAGREKAMRRYETINPKSARTLLGQWQGRMAC